jgi:hypothetical protein
MLAQSASRPQSDHAGHPQATSYRHLDILRWGLLFCESIATKHQISGRMTKTGRGTIAGKIPDGLQGPSSSVPYLLSTSTVL